MYRSGRQRIGVEKQVCSLRNCLWMEGRKKVQEELGRENVLG